jgi:polyhydroxyalkanoate synthesis regulator phasin
MAEKKAAGKRGGKAKAGTKVKPKKASAAKAKKAPARKPGARKPSAKRAASNPTTGLDKSVAQFRENLEHSVTLSRERIQEVIDDAVKRGRMTHGDAEKMLGELVKRGRRQTDVLLGELERLVRQARKEVGGRAEPVRKQATQAARRARKKLG